MLQGWSNTTPYGGVYGVARDGHVIYGPYNAKGEIWGCEDHDMCNGFFLPDGSYGYATTTTYPYTSACWGPAPAQTFASSCSTNGCPLGATYKSAVFAVQQLGGLASAILFASNFF